MRKDTKMNRWTWRVMAILITIHYSLFTASAQDVYNQIDESGNITQRNQNFNKHNNDTTNHNKEIPKGLKTWTVDRKFGNVIPPWPTSIRTQRSTQASMVNTTRPATTIQPA